MFGSHDLHSWRLNNHGYKSIQFIYEDYNLRNKTSLTMKSFFLITFFVATALSMPVFEDDTFGREMNQLLEKLNERVSFEHRLNNYRYTDRSFKIGGRKYYDVKTGGITLEGIENLKRSSPAQGDRSRGWTQIVDRVDFSVKGGFNLTSSLEFFFIGKKYSAEMKGTWKNPNQDAIFRLKGVEFPYQEKFKLSESTNNIFNNMFEITLTCDDSEDQELCNQIQVHYLNSWDFDLHRYFQDTLQSEVNKITFDGWTK